jgi:hypothetical protein
MTTVQIEKGKLKIDLCAISKVESSTHGSDRTSMMSGLLVYAGLPRHIDGGNIDQLSDDGPENGRRLALGATRAALEGGR